MPVNATVSFDVLKRGLTDPITMEVRDPRNGDLTDVVSASTFRLININTNDVEDSGSFTADGGTKITHVSLGTYDYQLDTSTYDGEYDMEFRCVLEGVRLNEDIYVKSVPAKYFAYAAVLRSYVDKARKSVSDDIENLDQGPSDNPIRFFYGYSTAHLIFYLERGMQILNAIPPFTEMTVNDFPFTSYGSVLIDAGIIAALEAQGIFAIDTDFPYALGGNSFQIDHFSKINAFLSSLLTRFDKAALSWKGLYRSPGSLMYQFLPGGARSARQLSSLPSGFWSRVISGVGI